MWAACLAVWLVKSVVGQEVPAGVGVNHSFSTVSQLIFMDSYYVPEKVIFP